MNYCPKRAYLILVVTLSYWLAACAPQPVETVQTENVEATVIARVEATLVANSVAVEQKVQATLTAIAGATRVAVASLPTTTATATPTSTSTPTLTDTATPSLESIPIDTPLPPPTPTADVYPHRAANNANLREGPGTDYPLAGGLQEGDRLRVLARTEDGSWVHIETLEGKQAWLAAFLVAPSPSLEGVPVAAAIPEPPTPATPTPAPVVQEEAPAQPAGQRLNVSFINPHYNCDREAFDDLFRYFQIDLFITNTSTAAVVAPWSPTAWIITDGTNERISGEMRQWCNRFNGCYAQPDIPPGGSEGWTWVTGRVELSEWVKGVVWHYQGQTYMQEFENNAINRAEWNYRSCP